MTCPSHCFSKESQYPDWYLQGLLGVTLSAGVPALHGLHAAVNQSAFFIAMLYIVAVGTGAVPRCMSSCKQPCICAASMSHSAFDLLWRCIPPSG